MTPEAHDVRADEPTPAAASLGPALLVGLAAAVVGSLVGWGVLWTSARDLSLRIADTHGIEIPVEVDPARAVAFGLLVAGLALLARVLAQGRAGTWRGSAAVVGGSLIAWTIAAWILLGADYANPAWAGPLSPLDVTFSASGEIARVASVGAFAGPLTALCGIVAGAWSGAVRPAPLRAQARDRFDRLYGRTAAVFVGGAVLVGLAGTWALSVGPVSELGDLTSMWTLAETPFATTLAAATVAWTISGRRRGTTVLLLVAATALLTGDLLSSYGYPPKVAAVMLGIATVLVASTWRPLADTLRRLTL
jgi:hypothetical protein